MSTLDELDNTTQKKEDKRMGRHYIEDCKELYFQENGDERGKLVVVEGGGTPIPFDIQRVFYIYGSDSTVIRGKHANRKSEFVLINVSGTSKVKVKDGKEEKVFVLNKPHMGLYIPTMLWKDMYDFSENSILLVLASEHYDNSEYIRDFEEYKKIVNENDMSQ